MLALLAIFLLMGGMDLFKGFKEGFNDYTILNGFPAFTRNNGSPNVPKNPFDFG
jgi:hypothetical protein